MMPGAQAGRNPSAATRSLPPAWGPEDERQYPFRTYVQDILFWRMQSDLLPHQQAAAIIQQLKGSARELARSLTLLEIFNGGVVNAQQLDPVSFLFHGLTARYAPLAEETRLASLTNMMQFQRRR